MSNVRNLEEIYKEIILDHYAHPRGCRECSEVSAEEKGHNVSCGDKVELKVNIDKGKLKDISVCSTGCAICVSSGSIMYGLIKKDNAESALLKINKVVDFIKGDTELSGDLKTKEIISLAGVKKFPARLKCALLPWITARNILSQKNK